MHVNFVPMPSLTALYVIPVRYVLIAVRDIFWHHQILVKTVQLYMEHSVWLAMQLNVLHVFRLTFWFHHCSAKQWSVVTEFGPIPLKIVMMAIYSLEMDAALSAWLRLTIFAILLTYLLLDSLFASTTKIFQSAFLIWPNSLHLTQSMFFSILNPPISINGISQLFKLWLSQSKSTTQILTLRQSFQSTNLLTTSKRTFKQTRSKLWLTIVSFRYKESFYNSTFNLAPQIFQRFSICLQITTFLSNYKLVKMEFISITTQMISTQWLIRFQDWQML